MAERKSFLLRLPDELYEELQRWARDELRSLNSQIEYVLRDSVRLRRRVRFPSDEATQTSIHSPQTSESDDANPSPAGESSEQGERKLKISGSSENSTDADPTAPRERITPPPPGMTGDPDIDAWPPYSVFLPPYRRSADGTTPDEPRGEG